MTDFPCCADLSKFVGKPFCWQTYNCWQFVVDFYRDAEIELKDYTPKDLSLSSAARSFAENINTAGFVEVTTPLYGDVVLCAGKRDGLFHVGVWLDGNIIHCASQFHGKGQVMIEELYFLKQNFRKVTYWRWQQ
ncbi:MAG: C40 family peptidase [Emcibacter sp.]|nr:C40 family peptidase [Emcibacter sp.]